MMFKTMLVKLYTILSSFTTNYTIVRGCFGCVLLQYVFLKVFLGRKIEVTIATLNSFLLPMYQSDMSV